MYIFIFIFLLCVCVGACPHTSKQKDLYPTHHPKQICTYAHQTIQTHYVHTNKHAFICACIHEYMHVSMHACKYTGMFVTMYASVQHTSMRVCMQYSNPFKSIQNNKNTPCYTRARTHIHTRIYTHTHTHTCMHTHASLNSPTLIHRQTHARTCKHSQYHTNMNTHV